MIPQRIPGLHEQLAYFRLWWPEFRCRVSAGTLTVTGDLLPSPISQTYSVRFDQNRGKAPDVRVVSPELKLGKNGEKIPHMYAQEKLCLFLPGTDEWKPDLPIATRPAHT